MELKSESKLGGRQLWRIGVVYYNKDGIILSDTSALSSTVASATRSTVRGRRERRTDDFCRGSGALCVCC